MLNHAFFQDKKSAAASITAIYAGGNQGALDKSTDGGQTWTSMGLATPDGYDNRDIYLVGDQIYIGREYGLGIYSDDAGANWTDISNCNFQRYFYDGANYFMVSGYINEGLYISSTGLPDSFSFIPALNLETLGYRIESQDVFAVNDFIVMTCLNRGLYYSTDYGDTWTIKTTTNGLGSNSTRRVLKYGDNWAVTTGSGVSISTNDCVDWTNTNTTNGLNSNDTLPLCYNPDSGKLFVGNGYNSIHYTTNNGTNWTTVAADIGMSNIYDIAYFDGKLYAVTDNGYASRVMGISSDEGATWTYIDGGEFTNPRLRNIFIRFE